MLKILVSWDYFIQNYSVFIEYSTWKLKTHVKYYISHKTFLIPILKKQDYYSLLDFYKIKLGICLWTYLLLQYLQIKIYRYIFLHEIVILRSV